MCMAEVAQADGGESNTELAKRCSSCGTLVDKLYQNDMCKGCLMHSFQRVIKVIDHYRAGHSGPVKG